MFFSGSVSRLGLVVWLSAASPAPDPALTLGDRLLQAGLVEQAITEYKRYIFFNSSRPGNETSYAFSQLAFSYRSLGRYDDAVEMLERAIQEESRDDVRDERRINLGIAEIARGRYDLANFALLKVEMFSPVAAVRDRASFLRGICNIFAADWDEARIAFRSYASADDSEARKLGERISQLLAEREGQRQKSPRVAKTLSTLVPGLGEMYAGDWRGGVSTLVMSASTAYLVFRDLAEKRVREAVLDSLLLFSRFYGGNRARAVAAAKRHNEAAGRNFVTAILRLVERQ